MRALNLELMEPKKKRDKVGQNYPCEESNCSNITMGGKPYCIDHLDKLPNIKQLMLADEAQEAEKDLLNFLKINNGKGNLTAFYKHVMGDRKQVEKVLKRLLKKKKIFKKMVLSTVRRNQKRYIPVFFLPESIPA